MINLKNMDNSIQFDQILYSVITYQKINKIFSIQNILIY